MIRLSIIIPAYNVAPWIEATLESIYCSQGVDLSTVEVVVVNDGSSDNTAQVVQSFAEAHSTMPVHLISQSNQGVSVARNHGLHEAKGEYVWFVDGDDLITSFAIQRIMTILDCYPKVDIVKTAKPIVFTDGEVNDIFPSQGQALLCKGYELFYEPYSGLYIYHGRHIWRRDMLIKNGIEFPVGIVINEDFCFTVKALAEAQTACDASWLLAYLYRKHNDSATGVRSNPDRFMPRVLSGMKALQMMKDSLDGHDANKQAAKARQRAMNLMVAMNITHLMDPLPLSFVRKSMRVLEEMGAYPFTPEQDHSRLLRFVLQHKWTIIAVSQYRRIKYILSRR
ncbi:MAG: glycosyltransferase [Prevotella sp.]|nr:glycosyltransferase [Candidatus Prevotella equi]